MRHLPHARTGLKTCVLIGITLVLVVGTLLAPRASAEESTAQCFGTGSTTIALDPGHGGADYGTSNANGLRESELNLDIAFRARDVLVNDHGYTVCLTRTQQNPNWSNTQRAEYANSVSAVRFVLIHFNSVSTESTNYTKTFWGKKNKDLKFSQVMHDALWPTLSKDSAGNPVNLTDGGVGQFATGALLKSTMPGTLVESVFLTNNAEANRLLDETVTGRRQQIADAVVQGIIRSLP